MRTVETVNHKSVLRGLAFHEKPKPLSHFFNLSNDILIFTYIMSINSSIDEIRKMLKPGSNRRVVQRIRRCVRGSRKEKPSALSPVYGSVIALCPWSFIENTLESANGKPYGMPLEEAWKDLFEFNSEGFVIEATECIKAGIACKGYSRVVFGPSGGIDSLISGALYVKAKKKKEGMHANLLMKAGSSPSFQSLDWEHEPLSILERGLPWR